MNRISGLRPALGTGALAVALLTLVPAPANAGGETCDGKPATIVVSSEANVVGTPGDDVIVVTTPDFVSVDGLDGDDTICGGPGINRIEGGPGNDTLYGGGGDDTIAGDSLGEPTDAAPARDDDFIDAGAGSDVVLDDWGDDTLAGGGGHDRLRLGFSNNDQGQPHADCVLHTARPVVDVGAGTVSGYGDDTFTGFESYVGGPFRAVILGSKGPDHIWSSTCGHAYIDGRGGPDLINGNSEQGGVVDGGYGNDRITISNGYAVRAGHGDDFISLWKAFYGRSPNRSTLDGGPGIDTVRDRITGHRVIDLRHGIGTARRLMIPVRRIENAHLEAPGGGTAFLIGTAARNVLIAPADLRQADGTFLHPILRGLAGDDRLVAGPHATAYGGPGRDFCRAGHRYSCEAH